MLTHAYALSGKLDLARTRRAPKPPELMRMLSTPELFRLMGPNLNPATCLDSDLPVGFQLTDLGEEHGYTVRRGVGHYRGTTGPSPDIRIELKRETLEALLGNRLASSGALQEGLVGVSGPREPLDRFLSFFDGWGNEDEDTPTR